MDWLMSLWLLSSLPLAFFFSGCPCCATCPCCDSTNVPAQVQIDIAGVGNSTCTGCTNLNGSWVLDLGPTNLCTGFTPNPAVVCLWGYADLTTGPICNSGQAGGDGSTGICITFGLNCTTPTAHEGRPFDRRSGTYESTYVFATNIGTLANCDGWSAFSLTFSLDPSGKCDHSSDTMTVTTL